MCLDWMNSEIDDIGVDPTLNVDVDIGISSGAVRHVHVLLTISSRSEHHHRDLGRQGSRSTPATACIQLLEKD